MRTHIDSLALVYARSLFELAEQAGGREKIMEVGDELEQITELQRSDPKLAEFIRSPIIDRAKKAGLINRAFGDRITDLTLRFLLVLNENDRLGHIDRISAGYEQMVHDAFGRVEVDVFTPSALDGEQMESIKTRVQSALGREPVLYGYTDSSMIGGIKLRIGDQLIDASVATRLRRMKDQLLASGGAVPPDALDRMIDPDGVPEGGA